MALNEVSVKASVGKKIYTQDEAINASLEYFKGDDLAARVWVNKYALKDSYGNLFEKTPDDMHRRLAREIYRIEKKYKNPLSEELIYSVLKDFKPLDQLHDAQNRQFGDFPGSRDTHLRGFQQRKLTRDSIARRPDTDNVALDIFTKEILGCFELGHQV